MNCKGCGDLLDERALACCWDLPIDYVAFNVYLCDGCGAICKQTVGGGLLWVTADNTVITEPPLPATAQGSDLDAVGRRYALVRKPATATTHLETDEEFRGRIMLAHAQSITELKT